MLRVSTCESTLRTQGLDLLTHFLSSDMSMQNCVKYCTPEERAAVFEELRPHCLSLAKDKYAHHIVIKMLDSGKFFICD